MPNLNEIDNTTAHGKETRTGLIVSSGVIIQSDWDQKDFREKQKDYDDMRKGDGVINGNLNASQLPLLNAGWNIEKGRDSEKAEEAANYIKWQFTNFKKGFDYFRRHCLLAIPLGCSFFERIERKGVKYNNGTSNKVTNIYEYMSPIQNDTLSKFHFDENGVFTGIEHERRTPEGGNDFVDVDSSKLFWNTWNEEYDNLEGNSILRPIREIWNLRKKVQRGLGIAVQRCGGIPVGTAYGDLGNQRSDAEAALRSVCNSENTYFLEHKEKFEFRLESINGIGEGNQLLEYYTRELFFNSLNQFMIAGIGQNGSRAATGEHKTTFELYTVNVLNWLENQMQLLTNDMMKIGYLQSIPVDDWPKFRFNNINQIDMLKAMQQITMGYEKGVFMKQPEDEKYFREFFGYPEKIEKKVAVGEVDNDEGKQQFEKSNCSHDIKLGKKKERRELTQFELDVYQFENAEQTFLDVQDEAETTIDIVIKKMLKDAAEQVKFNKDKDITIRYGNELTGKLTKIYEKSFNEGTKDLNIELSKVDKNRKLALSPKIKIRVNKKIDLRVKRLMNSIKTTLESKLADLTDVFIQKAGGIADVILGFDDAFKTDRRALITQTQSGYTDGRGAAIKENQKEIKTFVYTAVLDSGLCEECAPFDGATLSLQEAISEGLNPFGSPTNSACEGGNKCRCHLIPSEVIRSEDLT
jgi:hypothetical protein